MARGFFAKFLATAEPYVMPPTWQGRIENVPVRSATQDYHFWFSCTVLHQLTHPGAQAHPAPLEAAKHGILRQVMPVAAAVELTGGAALQAQLATQLGVPCHELNGQLRVWATDVVVSVDDADLQAVHQRHDLQRKLQVWQHEKEMERRECEFTAEMLTDPNRAVAWWLSRNPQQVAQAVGMIEPIARLSAAIHGPAEAPAEVSAEDQLLAAAEQLFAELDEWNRPLLGDQLAKTLATFGHADLAARLRDRLDAQGLAT
ncbi:hypothetical protein [Kutzneria kofuensis]|uniref:Uncharacterized protein n=1 Tax=Kutzneria kofuensis TaxID=103725 RepID=A0A7W9KK86_9PSEU|nr:hypothetical protein [Kutzneria kofuensis]MBB5894106.1 hypothetical protein [Kutzneria kofuensis]